ncbi:MAG: cupredoxin family copper-binding protein [Ilumatobacteraceae bacterium]
MTSRQHRLGSAARLIAAVAVLVGGLVHLQLYFDGYRNLPDANLGRSFVANGVGSVVVAALLVLRREALVRLAGVGIVAGTLTAFALSRTGDGVFGLRETGLQPAPQAIVALIAELLAGGLLIASFLPTLGGGALLPRRVGMIVAGAVVVGAAVAGGLWSHSGSAPTPAAPSPGNVVIAGFAFDADVTTVVVGSTITWTNSDAFAHSVVAGDGSFKSDRLATGVAFSQTFDAPGTYAYICGIHPSMTGSVVVTG